MTTFLAWLHALFAAPPSDRVVVHHNAKRGTSWYVVLAANGEPTETSEMYVSLSNARRAAKKKAAKIGARYVG